MVPPRTFLLQGFWSQWMVSMRIRVMSVIMWMVMIMTVTVPLRMRMPCSDSFNMMMMTFLAQTNLVFKSKKLFPILTELAIHVIITISDFFHTFRKSIQN